MRRTKKSPTRRSVESESNSPKVAKQTLPDFFEHPWESRYGVVTWIGFVDGKEAWQSHQKKLNDSIIPFWNAISVADSGEDISLEVLAELFNGILPDETREQLRKGDRPDSFILRDLDLSLGHPKVWARIEPIVMCWRERFMPSQETAGPRAAPENKRGRKRELPRLKIDKYFCDHPDVADRIKKSKPDARTDLIADEMKKIPEATNTTWIPRRLRKTILRSLKIEKPRKKNPRRDRKSR